MTNEINKTDRGRIEVIHDSDTIIDIDIFSTMQEADGITLQMLDHYQ